MPTYTARLTERAKERLLYWEREVKLDNQRGLTDINKAAENFYRGLLNIILDAELINMNLMKMDFPAVDLAEKGGGLCVQVTSSEGRDKINHTLKEFFGNDLQKTYQRLIVVIIGTKPKYNKTPFPTKDGFVLDRDADIWDTAKLLQQIEGLSGDKLKAVDEYLTRELGEAKQPALRLPIPEQRNIVGFLGRKTELAWIEDELKNGTKPVVVAGLGGVGKTALVIEFQKRHWLGQTYYVQFQDTFTRTLASTVGQEIPIEECKGLNEKQRAELAIRYLRRCDPADLLILDINEVPYQSWRELTGDPFYGELRCLSMAVLMATRHRDTGGMWLGRLEQDELRQVFRGHEVDISEEEMDSLIDAVNGHTMTVDMIARTIRESWGEVTAANILTAMKKSTLHTADFDEIENDHNPEQRQIYAHLRALFDLSRINEDGCYALRCAALLPQGGMDAKLFRTALPEGAAKEIKKLEKLGWVDLKDGRVSIHPVVRLVCRTELKPTEENCRKFLLGIKNQYDRKQYSSTKFCQMAELFENAADLPEDKTGFWEVEAGFFWNQVGKPERALPMELRAVQKREEYQHEPEMLAAIYNNVGGSYYALGDYKEALAYYEKALEIREHVLPKNHPDIAQSYDNIGGAYIELEDYSNGLAFFLKALCIRESVLPDDHLDLAISYNNVGGAYGLQGDREKEMKYYLKALELRERVLPDNHPDLALGYNNVAMAYGDRGDRKRELTFHLKALKIREAVLPSNHPDLAQSYNNVAGTYRTMGDHKKACEYLMKALRVLEQALPSNHPRLAMVCSNVAWIYHALGQLDEAVSFMRRAAQIAEQSTLLETHHSRMNYSRSADEMERELVQKKKMEQAIQQKMRELGMDPFCIFKR